MNIAGAARTVPSRDRLLRRSVGQAAQQRAPAAARSFGRRCHRRLQHHPSIVPSTTRGSERRRACYAQAPGAGTRWRSPCAARFWTSAWRACPTCRWWAPCPTPRPGVLHRDLTPARLGAVRRDRVIDWGLAKDRPAGASRRCRPCNSSKTRYAAAGVRFVPLPTLRPSGPCDRPTTRRRYATAPSSTSSLRSPPHAGSRWPDPRRRSDAHDPGAPVDLVAVVARPGATRRRYTTGLRVPGSETVRHRSLVEARATRAGRWPAVLRYIGTALVGAALAEALVGVPGSGRGNHTARERARPPRTTTACACAAHAC